MNLWKCHMSDIENLNSLSQQNAMRIRVNRVPLMQELNVEHILDHLVTNKVLQEDEVASILHSGNKRHQARALLQILVNKDRSSQWYKHFTGSLRVANCDSATRKRYAMLTEFLDNTIIRKDVVVARKEDLSFPRYEPLPQIEKGLLTGVEHTETPDQSPEVVRERNEEDTEELENYQSLLESTFQQQVETLTAVPMKAVKAQVKAETVVYHHVRKIEFFIRNRRHKEGVYLCTLPPVSQIIRIPRLRPLAHKYISALERQFLIPVMSELSSSYQRLVDDNTEKRDKNTRNQISKTGLLLCDLFIEHGKIRAAEEIVSKLVRYLCLVDDIDSWQQTFLAQVKLMEARTANWFLNEADQAFHAAQHTLDKIELMSFGQDLVDKSEFMAHVGHMLLMQGSHQPGYDFATRALKDLETSLQVHGTNRNRVSKVIQLTIIAYYEKWNGNRAQRLAVFFVRFAWVHFGSFSTTYIRALLSLVRVLTRFRPSDPFTVEVAKNAVSYAELIFSCETPLLAEAYMMLAEALIASKCSQGVEYLKYAKMSLQTAMQCLGENHPHVAWFSLTLGKALLYKAQASEESSSVMSTLSWAESESRKALEKLVRHFGDISLPSCDARVTLASIFKHRGRREEAIKLLVFVENVHRLCVSPRSHVALFFASHFARHLRADVKELTEIPERDEEEEKALEHAKKNAMRLAKKVIDDVECYGTYTPWVEQCYDIVEASFAELGFIANAEETQKRREEWLVKNALREEELSWESLHQSPDPKFLEEWDIWGKRKSMFLKGARVRVEQKEKAAEDEMGEAEEEEEGDENFSYFSEDDD